MPPHNVFTEIDARSYAAIVKNGYLSEVLLALLIDPLEAEDVADSIKSRSEMSIKIDVNGRVSVAPITLKDFQSLPSKDAFEKMKITLSQWVMTTEQAGVSLSGLTMWDRRFGVWCACAVAKEVLRFIQKTEKRPLRAIDAAESWVYGKTKANRVRDAAYAADVAAAYAADAAAYAAASAGSAAYVVTATSAGRAAHASAADAAYAAADAATFGARVADYSNARAAELIRLREVVAKACLTFPG